MSNRRWRENQEQIARSEEKWARYHVGRAQQHFQDENWHSAFASIRMAAEREAAARRARRRAGGKSIAEANCCVPGLSDREEDLLEKLKGDDNDA